MSFEILKESNFGTINPADIISYLKNTGWGEYTPKASTSSYTRKGITLLNSIEGKDFDVFIPLNSSFSDFSLRVKDVLHELERFEDRTAEKIFYDIKHIAYDVVRFRVIHPQCASGELPLEGNSKLIDGAKELIATSVQSLTDKKAYFPRRTIAANDYLKKVHAAQSEVGSYILKLTIPVPPARAISLPIEEDLRQITDPLERNVTKHMMESLNFCYSAAEEAILQGNIDPLTNKFSQGINANLLFALTKMGEIFESNDLEISTSWSGNRPSPQHISRRTFIYKDWIQYIKEAARVLKDESPIDDFELIGHVTRLEGTQGTQASGKVVISGIIDNQMKNVKVDLKPESHAIAYQAYGNKDTVKCIGELKKDGRSYILANPRNFEIIETE